MARPILILMLMMTQLLSGTGVSVYLCIGCDGSFGIHAGSDSCPPCQSDSTNSCHSCRDSAPEHHQSSCARHGSERPTPDTGNEFVAEASCGCTHIPVVVSSDQPSRAVRTSVTVDVEQFRSLVALPTFIGSDWHVLSRALLDDYPASAVADFFLTVVSTVVIRC